MDRTTQTVRRQLAAMACNRYEIGILDEQTGRMLERTWAPDELVVALPWLKRMNAGGAHIFIRPADEPHGLIFVDDLSSDQVAAMKATGHEPALIVESSPGNLHVWVRVSPVSGAARRCIAVRLAATYQGDPNSAQTRHYGRLAGFTNRKVGYRNDAGQYPWVLLRESSGCLAAAAPELVRIAEGELEAADNSDPVPSATPSHHRPQSLDDAMRVYCTELDRLKAHYGGAIDYSRVDWMAGRLLLERGFSQDVIQQTMRRASHNLDERKKGHVEDYIDRTIRNLLAHYSR